MMEGFSRLLSMKIYANWCNEYVGSRERLLLCSLEWYLFWTSLMSTVFANTAFKH